MTRPATRAGQQLRSILLPDAEQRASEILKEAAALLTQSLPGADLRRISADVLALLVRRSFPDRRRRDIASYARNAVHRTTEERHRGRRTRVVEAVIRAGLGEPAAIDGIGKTELAKAQLMLMRELVLAKPMTPEQVDELIAHAEVHRQRQSATSMVVRTRMFRRRKLRPRRRRPADREAAIPTTGDDVRQRGPSSLVGRRLRAVLVTDREALARVPDHPLDDDALAVLDALFTLVTKRRFGEDYDVREVTQFVLRVAQYAPSGLPTSFIATEAIARSQLGEPIPIDDIDQPSAVEVKALLSRIAVLDLALLDREVDEVLVEAERMAKERGFGSTGGTSGSGTS